VEVAVPAPDPPAPPPHSLLPWTLATGDLLTWAPAASAGPAAFVGRDFRGVGFSLAVGAHHFEAFDPNPPEVSGAARVASLGLLSLSRGALWGNERGVELIRLVSRVLRADQRTSLPSVLGTIVPAVGFTVLSSKDTQPHAGLRGPEEGLLLRWSFGLRRALVESPVWTFVELEPTVQLLVPADGSRAHGSLGLNLNVGMLPLVN
jgi:hypothetical protein